MPLDISQTMESASEALRRMDYLECEARCLEALGAARRQSRWADYRRILLPLQECRRQRRMIAAEGVVRLGTAGLAGGPADWLGQMDSGCVVVTHPHGRDEARALEQAARTRRRYLEVLWSDGPTDGESWRIRSFAGPDITCTVPAPPASWRARWLAAGTGEGANTDPVAGKNAAHAGPGGPKPANATAAVKPALTPADWFLNAGEALGDAVLAEVKAPAGAVQRVIELERGLAAATDHELLHQHLADAARRMMAGR